MFTRISYVGNLARHLLREPNINYPDLRLVSANPSSAINAFVPYKGYSIIQQYLSDSTSNYNSLQAYLSKRAGNVLFTGGYTWSKLLGDTSAQGDNIENWQNRHFNYGPLTFDRRHSFTGTFVWQLAAFHNQNAVVRGALGGWQLSGVIRVQTGAPVSLTAVTITGNGTRRADYLGGSPLVANPGPNQWINPAAFGVPPTSRFGNSGEGIIIGPNLQSYDFSLAKHFTFRERFDLKFQGDFFNLFNITNYQNITNLQAGTPSFGTISSAYPPRNVQLSLKLAF
jgi:hypothetical protein